jgi:eukaryotic-like serine/threonine-protein kinase
MAAEDVFGIVGTTQAGNFRVERVVAEGGFAVIYQALHGGFRAPVALKCLKIPEQMSKKERDVFLEKFREEAELMFRLSAAIVEICRPLHVDVLYLADGRFVPYLALEWLEGESFDGIITRRREAGQPPLGLKKVVKMMRPIASALARAHRFPGPEGTVAIIHRDLKPENIFVANLHGSEAMKILDFGIAKAKSAATQAVGRVTGYAVAEDEMASFTPAYGAPEQWIPKTWGETGPWTDVWGLALSMVEALVGAPPLDGEPWAMRRGCLDEKRRPTPRNHGADVPIEVDRVFEQALALDPRRRFNTIEAFWTELEKAMGLPPSLAPRDDRREPSDDGAESPTSAAAVSAGERLARIELKKMNLPRPAAPRQELSGELELDLAAAPPSQRADLEMNLPTWNDAPPVSSSRGALEMSLPMRSEEPAGPPPAPPPRAVPAPPPPPAATATPPPAAKPPPAPEPPRIEEPLDFDLNLPPRLDARPLPLSSIGTPGLPPPAGFQLAPGSMHRPDLAPIRPHRRRERQEVSERLRAPLGILLLALAVASSEIGYHRFIGGELTFGGVRPFYIAAPLALLGVGFTLWRLMEERDDD